MPRPLRRTYLPSRRPTTPDERIWYLYTAEGQQGPYTAAELRQWLAAGQITAEWHVWREGFANWQTIGQTPDLAAAPAPPPAPPPLVPQAAAKAVAAAPKAEAPKKEEKKPAKKAAPAARRFSPAFVATIGFIVFGVGGVYGAAYLYPGLLPAPVVIALGMQPPAPPPVAPPPGVEIRTGPPGLLGDLPAGAAWGVHLEGAGAFVGKIARSEAWRTFAKSPAGRRLLADTGRGETTPLDLLDPLLREEAAAAAYVEGEAIRVVLAGRGELPAEIEKALAAGGPAEAVQVGEIEARRFPLRDAAGGDGPTHVWAMERDGVVYLTWQGAEDALLEKIIGGGEVLRTDDPYVAAGEEIPDGAVLWGFVDGGRAAALAKTAMAAAPAGLPVPGLAGGAEKTHAFAVLERADGVEAVIVSRGGTPPPVRPLKTARHAPAAAIAYASRVVDPAAPEFEAVRGLLAAAGGGGDPGQVLGGEVSFTVWTDRNAAAPRFGFLLEAKDEKAALDLLEGLLRARTADLDPARVRTIGGVEARVVRGPVGADWALGPLGDGVVALASDLDALAVLAEAPSKGNLASARRLDLPAEAVGAVLVDLAGLARVSRALLEGVPMTREQRAEARAALDLFAALGEVRGQTVVEGDARKTTLRIAPPKTP